ncbi:hypothetical protein ABT299_51305 [Spirillospora sp. NPDC000708]
MSSLAREVVELAEHADAMAEKLSRHGDGLRLADTGATAESLNDVIDAVTAMFGVLVKRVALINSRKAGGSGRDSASLLEEAELIWIWAVMGWWSHGGCWAMGAGTC